MPALAVDQAIIRLSILRTKAKQLVSHALSFALAFACLVGVGGLGMVSLEVGSAYTSALSQSGQKLAYASNQPNTSGQSSTDSSALPSSYYLMNHGLSTPAKLQSPWGDCWAFAVASALESSILKKQEVLDEMESEEALPVSKASGRDRTSSASSGSNQHKEADYSSIAADEIPLFELASEKIDLSERAIAWFAHELQTEASAGSQAGEGYSLVNKGDLQQQLSEGNFAKVTSLLASGQLIVGETTVPYRYNGYSSDPLWYSLGSFNGAANDARTRDWSVPESLRTDKTVDWRVTEVTKLPSPANVTTDYMTGLSRYQSYNAIGTRAIKEALLNTGAVAIAITAETSVPSEITSGNFAGTSPSEHFTYSTWSQYDASTTMIFNHAVSIVGWDDDYSASNFAGTASGTPPADGAWLCKNNWGSDEIYASEGDLGDALHWGLNDANGNATGYYWLSYYDHTIHDPTVFEVAPADSAYDNTYQYDYLGSAEFSTPATYDGDVWTCNVFEAETTELLRSISCETFKINDTVEIEVFRLPMGSSDGSNSGTSGSGASGSSGTSSSGGSDGNSSASSSADDRAAMIDDTDEMLPVAHAIKDAVVNSDEGDGASGAEQDPASGEENEASSYVPDLSPLDGLDPQLTIKQRFSYAGFHAIALEHPMLFTEGERFAVAMKVSADPGTSGSSQGASEDDGSKLQNITYLGLELAYLNNLESNLQNAMANVVIHEGESYVSLSPGSWMDVVEFSEGQLQLNQNAANARAYGNALTKAYTDYSSMVKRDQIYKVVPLA